MTIRSFLPALALGLLVASADAAPPADAPSGKIAPWVLEKTEGGAEAEFLVVLAEKADLRPARALPDKHSKGHFVHAALLETAQRSQAGLLAELRGRGVEHRAFITVNAVWVKGPRELVEALASRPEVARIEGNPSVRGIEPEWVKLAGHTEPESLAPLAIDAVELGVNAIRAPEVWAQGFTGQGVVVAGADTGISWTHPALQSHYRGWNGSSASHDYNWHDSVHSGGGTCGANTTAPCDDDSHGTHTIGTAVGGDGGSNQIGVAPGAKFIGCRNMNQGNGTPAMYIECMDFFLAPYPIGGTPGQGDPSKAPDITTNSWGCPPSEGCSPGSLQAAVEAQRAAGIMMVVAAGNSGSSCSTTSDPPSFYDAAYTAGAVSGSTGTIASFSSRGPVTIDGSNRRKPDISAPGVSVRSSVPGGGYSSFSGTSMATPHVAGALALLFSAHPALSSQLETAEGVLNDAAVDVSVVACSSSGVPNNVYGYGRLDIKAAVDLGSASIAPASQAFASGGGANTVNVTAAAGAAWQTFVNDSWITVPSGGSGSGNGSVNYNVAANGGASARTGSMFVAGRKFTVTQAAGGGCSYSINPTSASAAAGGGTGSVAVTADAGCPWTAAPNVSWLHVTSGASGSGNGSTGYSVDANSGGARSGTLTVAGQTFTVNQAAAAACTYTVSPLTQAAGRNGGAFTASVTAAAGCAWTAVSNASWITVTSGAGGSGNGTVGYSVAAIAKGAKRTGTLTIAGKTLTVSQSK